MLLKYSSTKSTVFLILGAVMLAVGLLHKVGTLKFIKSTMITSVLMIIGVLMMLAGLASKMILAGVYMVTSSPDTFGLRRKLPMSTDIKDQALDASDTTQLAVA